MIQYIVENGLGLGGLFFGLSSIVVALCLHKRAAKELVTVRDELSQNVRDHDKRLEALGEKLRRQGEDVTLLRWPPNCRPTTGRCCAVPCWRTTAVRLLRDAGWEVEVGEPETDGLFIVVRASAGETDLGIALLYSCATANEVYRKLAKDNDVILYRGAPYHQQAYAYGIDAHVGPVAGWQPPCAPA